MRSLKPSASSHVWHVQHLLRSVARPKKTKLPVCSSLVLGAFEG